MKHPLVTLMLNSLYIKDHLLLQTICFYIYEVTQNYYNYLLVINNSFNLPNVVMFLSVYFLKGVELNQFKVIFIIDNHELLLNNYEINHILIFLNEEYFLIIIFIINYYVLVVVGICDSYNILIDLTFLYVELKVNLVPYFKIFEFKNLDLLVKNNHQEDILIQLKDFKI